MIFSARDNSVFNSLLDVGDAYSLAKVRDIDNFIESASEIAIRRNLDARIGCFILHRHNLLADNEIMVRSERTNESGQIGVATRPTRLIQAGHTSPVSFQLGHCSGELTLIPLEYSTILSDLGGFESLCESEEFVLEFFELARRMDLDRLVGISIVSKLIPSNTMEVVVERFSIHEGVHENIVSIESAESVKGLNAIPTTWSLAGKIYALDCLRQCIDRSPGHSTEHVSCSNWA